MLKYMHEVAQLGRGRVGLESPATGIRAGQTQTGHRESILQKCSAPLCSTGRIE